jgi:hypothetical protein
MLRKSTLAMSVCAVTLMAHPLGNFSVNHYMKFEAGPRGVEMTYAIDLAEIPTFEMLREWELAASSPREQLEQRAALQAQIWCGIFRSAWMARRSSLSTSRQTSA